MTLSEFKAWVEGYTLAGGKDTEVIKAKLAEVIEITPLPYNPVDIPMYPIVPVNPWNPNPFLPSPTTWPIPSTWCGTGTSTCDPEIVSILYNA